MPTSVHLVNEEDHRGREVKVAGRLNETSSEGRHQERSQGQINPSDKVAEVKASQDLLLEIWRRHWNVAVLVWAWPVALMEDHCSHFEVGYLSVMHHGLWLRVWMLQTQTSYSRTRHSKICCISIRYKLIMLRKWGLELLQSASTRVQGAQAVASFYPISLMIGNSTSVLSIIPLSILSSILKSLNEWYETFLL